MYSGMRRGEILTLRWESVDTARQVLRVPHTKTGTPLELPITRQLASILERRRRETGGQGWVFPSAASKSGHISVLTHLCTAWRAPRRRGFRHGRRLRTHQAKPMQCNGTRRPGVWRWSSPWNRTTLRS